MPDNGNRSLRDRMADIAKKMRAIDSAMLECSDSIKKNDTDVNDQDRRMRKRIADAHDEKSLKQTKAESGKNT